ncbi:cupin domain-containing protein [Thiohalocapsa sp. ML1]|uniref:cupin domain-containing protein n=1 Tax=Thiohalocapsa sp. ML1 TaxID=1431688 RepID=UPI00073244EE|nr:cupin domain-containing protein [Thiohalocapsa sp. ML1]
MIDLPRTLRWPDGLDAARFLRDFWQRRPLLLPGAFPGIRSPVEPDELAGLACDPDVESRIVHEHDPKRPWQVSHGPFDEAVFANLPETHWTLLVQDVDKHVPAVAELLACFDFLPAWRLDDIMISWAEDGGSVGPHLDQYDVFLVQVQGHRRWRIVTRPNPPTGILPDLDLRILRDFEPDQDWLLGPGDVLYLPPGVPHWGIAEGPCMTWSVGLRAPAWHELAADWFQHLLETRADDSRWRDPPEPEPAASIPDPAELPASLPRIMRSEIERLVADADEDLFRRWLGATLTEQKPNIALLPPEPAWPGAEVLSLLRARGELRRDGASRLLYLRGVGADEPDLLFANGDCHALPAGRCGFLPALCRRPGLLAADAERWLADAACVALLAALFNAGHFVIPDDGLPD